ncbi:cell division protein ZapB [Geoalkalibacter sp.]|uniref:cell division protein ZapB n=1 Tax=Geoalkalibacter sp. TaxID=3041440 RepID=UPI00272E7A6E|nr:cell division protein ZapB [Geoalkalibacter sp.]
MNLNTLQHLEQKIDQLLARVQSLDEECRRLRESNESLLKERERFCQELDRILAKLGPPDQGSP